MLILSKWEWLLAIVEVRRSTIGARLGTAGERVVALFGDEQRILDLDLLELRYAIGKSEYDRGGDQLEFASLISTIGMKVRHLASEQDYEHQVWARFLEIESQLLRGGPEYPTDLAHEAMALIRSTPDTPSSWHGEALLRLAQIETAQAMWSNALESYRHAVDQFRKDLTSASSICGLANAYDGIILTAMMFGHPERWQALDAIGQVREQELNQWDTGDTDIMYRPPLLSLQAIRQGSATIEQLAATEIVKLLAVLDKPERQGPDFARRDDWCRWQVQIFDGPQPGPARQAIDHIRVNAARTGDFADGVIKADGLLGRVLEDRDLLTAMRIMILKDRLFALLFDGDMPLEHVQGALSRMARVADDARSSGWIHIYQEAATTAHFVVSIADVSAPTERGALLPALSESGEISIPAELDKIYPSRESTPRGWYELVLGGEVDPVGILAY